MIDVHRKFRLLPETLYIAVLVVDRYLSLKQIEKSTLHILGVTALYISTKYEEIYPPDLVEFLTVSENKFAIRDVVKMEFKVLKTLEFDLTNPSPYRFLERFHRLFYQTENHSKCFFLS